MSQPVGATMTMEGLHTAHPIDIPSARYRSTVVMSDRWEGILDASPRSIDGMADGMLVASPSSSSSRPYQPGTPKREKERHARKVVRGDRFIPHRDDSDVQAAFQLMSNEPTTPNKHKRKISAADMDAQKEEANETFATLLSSEIFGADSNAFAAAAGVRRSHEGGRSLTASPFAGSSTGPQHVAHPSQPTTPTKRNIFHYGTKSPARGLTSQSRSTGALFRSPSASPSRRGSQASPNTVDGDSPSAADFITAMPIHSVYRSPSRPSSSSSTASQGLFGGRRPSTPNRRSDTLDSPSHRLYSTSPVSLDSQKVLQGPRKSFRSLSKVPYKVLDAPDLADDFYLNLVDWSNDNVLGVGLSNCVYLWSAQTSNVTKLCEVDRERDRVTSVNWSGRGKYLAVGLNSGTVQIWDTERVQLLRTFTGHTARVGSLAWNEFVLSTGSRDRSILHRDVRVRDRSIRELKGHTQEICGLRWNTNTNQLASGGNDNKLFVWDGLGNVPLYRFTHHRAAVKAIAWSPHQNGLLASGGGTADMHIRFFNTITGTLLSEVDTGSQVCNLAWSKINNEIISTHGFSGGKISNQVQVWRYPDMSQVATLMGHTMRVLYLAMSPDGESAVSGAGDETLRFWDLNTTGSDGKGILSSVPHSTNTPNRGILAGVGGSMSPFGRLR